MKILKMGSGDDQGFVVDRRALVRVNAPLEDDLLIRFPGVAGLGIPFVHLYYFVSA